MTPGFSVSVLAGFLCVSSHQKTLCMQMPEAFSERNHFNSSFCTPSHGPQFDRKWLQWQSLGSNVSLFSVTCTLKKHLHSDVFWLCPCCCWGVVNALLSCSCSSLASHSLGLPWGQMELFPGEPLPWLQAICKHDHKLQNRGQSACVLHFFIYYTKCT